MEELLTPEMKAVIASLGELIKADPRHLAIREAIDEYERSEELNNLIAEYNMQQNALADAYGKNGEADDAGRSCTEPDMGVRPALWLDLNRINDLLP